VDILLEEEEELNTDMEIQIPDNQVVVLVEEEEVLLLQILHLQMPFKIVEAVAAVQELKQMVAVLP